MHLYIKIEKQIVRCKYVSMYMKDGFPISNYASWLDILRVSFTFILELCFVLRDIRLVDTGR